MNSYFGSKRGGPGFLISMFVAIIAIVIILSAFVFISAPVKKFSEKPSGIVSYDEKGMERNLFEYMEEREKLSRVGVLVEEGVGVDEAIREVGYEE